MSESRNKLRGNRSKAPVIYTGIICILLGLAFIFYASYAYLGYIRINHISKPGVLTIINAMGTLFKPESLQLPITPEVIGEVLIMQVRDIWWVYLSIAVIVLLSVTSGKTNDYRGMEHGSARWADKYDEKRFSDSTGIPCGNNFYLTVNRPKKLFFETNNLNELVIGSSGAGKSFRKIKPDIIQMTGSYVITDTSGELYRDTAAFLKSHGYIVKVFNLKDIQYSNTYNPFAYVTNENELLNLANLFMESTAGEGERADFWTGSAEKLLFTVMLYFFHSPDEEATFGNVVRLLSTIEFDKKTKTISEDCKIAKCVAEHQFRRGTDDALSIYWNSIKGQPEETFGGIRATVEQRLMHWVLPDMDTLTSTDEMNFDDIGVHKTAIFLMLPTADSTYAAVANLFYSQLFKRLRDVAEKKYNARLPLLVSFELDEFANIGRIPEFNKTLSVVRKYNIRICIVLQGLSQLRAIYDKQTENVISNCSTLTLLGTDDQETTEYISKKIGTTTVRDDTRSHNTGNQGGGTQSESYHERPLLKPDEIARALAPKRSNNNLGSCIVFVQGFSPFFLTKYDISKHKLYNQLGSYKGENQKNNSDIYADYEELKKQHENNYKRSKNKPRRISEAVEKESNDNSTFEEKKEESNRNKLRQIFEQTSGTMLPYNDKLIDPLNDIDETKEG